MRFACVLSVVKVLCNTWNLERVRSSRKAVKKPLTPSKHRQQHRIYYYSLLD